MPPGDSREIETQPLHLAEEDAMEQVGGQLLAKVKSAVADVEPVYAELRYKPYYAFDITLTKKVFRGENVVTQGSIVVDAMTDVARPFTKETVEEETVSVSAGEVIDPQVTEDAAETTANSRRMQVQHREKGEVEMADEPRLVYKPVWLVELSNGKVRVVDGVNGKVFSNMVLG